MMQVRLALRINDPHHPLGGLGKALGWSPEVNSFMVCLLASNDLLLVASKATYSRGSRAFSNHSS
jgi:hypothetical protein